MLAVVFDESLVRTFGAMPIRHLQSILLWKIHALRMKPVLTTIATDVSAADNSETKYHRFTKKI